MWQKLANFKLDLTVRLRRPAAQFGVRHIKESTMALFMSKDDVHELLQFAALAAASRVGLRSVEWNSFDDVVSAVRSRDTRLGDVLQDFLQSYTAWYEFHERVEHSGRQGNLSPSEVSTLTKLIGIRDSTRATLVHALKGIESP
jgi:hypothetical protein